MLSTMDNITQESQDQHSRFPNISNVSMNIHTEHSDKMPSSDADITITQIQTNTNLPSILSIDPINTNISNNIQPSLPKLSSLKPIAQIPLLKATNISETIQVSSNNEQEQSPSVFKPRIPIEDVLALREFLRQVDLRHYGFCKEDKDFVIDNPSLSHLSPKSFNNVSSSSILLNSPRSGSDHQSVSRFKSRADGELYSSGHEDDDSYVHGDFDSIKNISMIRHHSTFMGVSVVPSSPLKAIRPSPMRTNSPNIPYKGKFGPNPKCASCQTTKTPYWRDAWNQGILLCNACGLRFAKFKRRCTQCHYVPRKEDKGSRFCPTCKGSWTQ